MGTTSVHDSFPTGEALQGQYWIIVQARSRKHTQSLWRPNWIALPYAQKMNQYQKKVSTIFVSFLTSFFKKDKEFHSFPSLMTFSLSHFDLVSYFSWINSFFSDYTSFVRIFIPPCCRIKKLRSHCLLWYLLIIWHLRLWVRAIKDRRGPFTLKDLKESTRASFSLTITMKAENTSSWSLFVLCTQNVLLPFCDFSWEDKNKHLFSR